MVNWREVRDTLWERGGGRCEASGLPLDPDTFDVHHRRPRGAGGTSDPDVHALWNLLALDPIVHNGQAHSVHQDPAWSRPRGYLLSKIGASPRIQPVLIRGMRWVLLGADGRYYPLPPGIPAR